MNIEKKLKVFLIEDAIKIRSVLIDILQQTGGIEVIGFAESEKDALNQLLPPNGTSPLSISGSARVTALPCWRR